MSDLEDAFRLRPIGRVRSPLARRGDAPRQGDEGAPDAWIDLEPGVRAAAADLAVGQEVLLLTWLDRADRATLRVHPRGDAARPAEGVFTTRSPDRPNPIGLHRVTLLAIEAGVVGDAGDADAGDDGAGTLRLRVRGLEALDATPVLDIKPVLGGVAER